MKEQFPTRLKMSLKLFLCLCVAYTATQGLAKVQRKVLTIGGLYASGAMTTFQNASGIIKIVNEAIRFINERSQLLPGYKLAIEWRDTMVGVGLMNI